MADEFYTMKGYARHTQGGMTSAMEDYLEMIARLTAANQRVRVTELSQLLHVKASSVTKMMQQLLHAGLICGQKYGEIVLTDAGREKGEYLLHRHAVLHEFLCRLNGSQNELEQVEKIEHFLDERTVKNLEKICPLLPANESGNL